MKKEYVIVFHNGLSYEDYESKVSKTFASKREAENYLDDNGYNYDEYNREWRNYSKDESKQYAFTQSLELYEALHHYTKK